MELLKLTWGYLTQFKEPPMKRLVVLSALALSFSALAAKVEIKSNDGKSHNITEIERSITVDSSNGRINVVEIDNGGSTDIGSAVYPSQLLVTFFQDGEMNNLRASFNLGPIYSLKSAKLKDKNNLVINVDIKDMQLQTINKNLNVDISDLRKKAANPEITVEEFETQTISAKVILSEKLGE